MFDPRRRSAAFVRLVFLRFLAVLLLANAIPLIISTSEADAGVFTQIEAGDCTLAG